MEYRDEILTDSDRALCRAIFNAAKRAVKPIMSELIVMGMKYPELKTEVDKTLNAARAERLMEKVNEIDEKLKRSLQSVFEHRQGQNELSGSGGGQ